MHEQEQSYAVIEKKQCYINGVSAIHSCDVDPSEINRGSWSLEGKHVRHCTMHSIWSDAYMSAWYPKSLFICLLRHCQWWPATSAVLMASICLKRKATFKTTCNDLVVALPYFWNIFWKSSQCSQSKVISLDTIPIWQLVVAAIFTYGTSCHEQKHFLHIQT